MTVYATLHLADGRDRRDTVEVLFRTTMVGGNPMPFFLDGLDDYTEFCIDWYFTAPGGAVVVAIDDDVVVGYALVCTDPAAYGRHVRRATLALAVRTAGRLVTGRLDTDSRRFYRDRARDSWRIWRKRARIDIVDEAHAHLNVAANARRGTVAAMLIDAIDDVVRNAGLDAWVGEVNGEANKRRRALERIVGIVLDEQPNVTASRLVGRPIVRYTVRRTVKLSVDFPTRFAITAQE
jgi:hypothetical protein